MPFHLPRRHRHRLLLPPGLLALAGLLLLGCLALRPWQELARVPGTIQLTVPIHDPHPALPTIRFLVPNPDTLCERRFRHDAVLNGNPIHDQIQYSRIAASIRFITADKKHNGMVCVRLASTAHYENMVALLDLMARLNSRKHGFDFTRKPVAFYVFSSREVYNPNEKIVYGGLINGLAYSYSYSWFTAPLPF